MHRLCPPSLPMMAACLLSNVHISCHYFLSPTPTSSLFLYPCICSIPSSYTECSSPTCPLPYPPLILLHPPRLMEHVTGGLKIARPQSQFLFFPSVFLSVLRSNTAIFLFFCGSPGRKMSYGEEACHLIYQPPSPCGSVRHQGWVSEAVGPWGQDGPPASVCLSRFMWCCHGPQWAGWK